MTANDGALRLKNLMTSTQLKVVGFASGEPLQILKRAFGDDSPCIKQGAIARNQDAKVMQALIDLSNGKLKRDLFCLVKEALKLKELVSKETSQIEEIAKKRRNLSFARVDTFIVGQFEEITEFDGPSTWNLGDDSLKNPVQAEGESDADFSARVSEHERVWNKIGYFKGSIPAGKNSQWQSLALGKSLNAFQIGIVNTASVLTKKDFDHQKDWAAVHAFQFREHLKSAIAIAEPEDRKTIEAALAKHQRSFESLLFFFNVVLAGQAGQIQNESGKNPLIAEGAAGFFFSCFEKYCLENPEAKLFAPGQNPEKFFDYLGLIDVRVEGTIQEFFGKKMTTVFRQLNVVQNCISPSYCLTDFMNTVCLSGPSSLARDNVSGVIPLLMFDPVYRQKVREAWEATTLHVDFEADDIQSLLFLNAVVFAPPSEVISLELLEARLLGEEV